MHNLISVGFKGSRAPWTYKKSASIALIHLGRELGGPVTLEMSGLIISAQSLRVSRGRVCGTTLSRNRLTQRLASFRHWLDLTSAKEGFGLQGLPKNSLIVPGGMLI
jgi:hypothetical protein